MYHKNKLLLDIYMCVYLCVRLAAEVCILFLVSVSAFDVPSPHLYTLVFEEIRVRVRYGEKTMLVSIYQDVSWPQKARIWTHTCMALPSTAKQITHTHRHSFIHSSSWTQTSRASIIWDHISSLWTPPFNLSICAQSDSTIWIKTAPVPLPFKCLSQRRCHHHHFHHTANWVNIRFNLLGNA